MQLDWFKRSEALRIASREKVSGTSVLGDPSFGLQVDECRFVAVSFWFSVGMATVVMCEQAHS